jgi:hypothetical protein
VEDMCYERLIQGASAPVFPGSWFFFLSFGIRTQNSMVAGALPPLTVGEGGNNTGVSIENVFVRPITRVNLCVSGSFYVFPKKLT